MAHWTAEIWYYPVFAKSNSGSILLGLEPSCESSGFSSVSKASRKNALIY